MSPYLIKMNQFEFNLFKNKKKFKINTSAKFWIYTFIKYYRYGFIKKRMFGSNISQMGIS